MIEQKVEILEQQIQSNKIYLIRTPFSIDNLSKAHKIITQENFSQIQNDQQDKIVINKYVQQTNKINFPINLYKKKLIRPMQFIKAKKLINKKTGKMIKVIRQVKNVQFIYEYEDMNDFITCSGSKELYGQKKYQLDQSDILNQIKKHLQSKIQGNELQINKEGYLHLIQPINYLKSFNLAPSLCDMFIEKIKHKKDDNQNSSINISFEDQVPNKFYSQAPQAIKQTEIYKKLAQYIQKRPCWLKNSIYFSLYQQGFRNKFTINDFKSAMKYLAFTYRNGPWKHIFCRFGFDPKNQYKSLIYQSMTIKLKQKEVEDYGNRIQQQIYDPTFRQISNRCIRSYQICDIMNQPIRQIMNGKIISKDGDCTKQHGWFNSNQHTNIMKIMKKHIQQSKILDQ